MKSTTFHYKKHSEKLRIESVQLSSFISEPCQRVWMLAFDIETTGLTAQDTITVACVYDPLNSISQTFVFAGEASQISSVDEFIGLLDQADTLCAFNGARFDIPFMQRVWSLSDERVRQWQLKLFDVYELCYVLFDEAFSLNKLLTANGIETKTGNGQEAVDWAREGKWHEIGEYCMQDTLKTYQVSVLPVITLPLRKHGLLQLEHQASTSSSCFSLICNVSSL